MMTDLRFALRQLLKSPGFTLLALLTLALGIGLNTAIFSLINDLFLRGLLFKEPGRVVHMYSNARERNLLELAVSVPRFQHFRARQKIFDGFGGENSLPFTLTGLGDPVQLFGGKVTSNFFDVLGVKPIRGRNFLPEEEETADVAMVTENFWQKRMGGDPNVIGRSITLDGVPHTIVGILPNLPFSWTGPNTEIWTTKPFVVPRFAQQHHSFVCLRKRIGQRNRRCDRCVVGLAIGPDCSENGGELSPVRSGYTSRAFSAGAFFHDRVVDFDRRCDGNLSGVAKLARRFGRRVERRRTRNERQRPSTAIPQNPGRRTGRPFSHFARRCGIAHHEFCEIEPAEHRLSPRKYVDRPGDVAASRLSRSRRAPAFRGKDAGRTACAPESPKRHDQQRHPVDR